MYQQQKNKDMIYLFKINDVFWDNKPKVNEYFIINSSEVEFDILKYDVSLYFPVANYCLLSESNDEEIYFLQFKGANINPERILMTKNSKYYKLVREFYLNLKSESTDKKH